MRQNYYNKIEEAISKGKTKLAIEYLLEYLNKNGITDESLTTAIIQSSKYHITEKEIRQGLIDYDKKEININKINATVLELAKDIKNKNEGKKNRIRTVPYLAFMFIMLCAALLYPNILLFYRRIVERPDYSKYQLEKNYNANNEINLQLASKMKSSTSELIEILRHRANEINKDLEGKYEYVQVKRFLKVFNRLHEQHILAIEEGNFILAHEILGKIYKLSIELENTEIEIYTEIEKIGYLISPYLEESNWSKGKGQMANKYFTNEYTIPSEFIPPLYILTNEKSDSLKEAAFLDLNSITDLDSLILIEYQLILNKNLNQQ